MKTKLDRLCSRARDGDREAASELLRSSYGGIYSYLRRLCGNSLDAEDLTQETFAKVWASLDSFGGRSSFRTWVYRIAYHVYVDWRRKRRPAEPLSDAWWQELADDGQDPFQDVAERQAAERLYAAVERLDEDKKNTIYLRYYEGLSVKETARILDVSPSTVKYRLREALRFLRRELAEADLACGGAESAMEVKRALPIDQRGELA